MAWRTAAPPSYGVVSDEIDTDPEVAFPAARDLGAGAVDLNSLWGRPVTALDDAQVGQVRELLARTGLRTFLVAGLPFKTLPVEGLTAEALLASDGFAAHMAVLERSLEIAAALEAPFARVHAFAWPTGAGGAGAPPPRRSGGGDIPPAVLPVIVAGLRAACAAAARAGLRLGLENVRASYGNSGRNVATILEAVGDARLQAVWDPANAYVSGEERPFPDGYAAVRGRVAHVHVKDAVLVDAGSGTTAWECVGQGAVDWSGQLQALAADGYPGLLCVETHWSPAGKTRAEATSTAFDHLRRLVAAGG